MWPLSRQDPLRAAREGAGPRPPTEAPRGPGPSKLIYRLSRTWAKPLVRNTVLVYLPIIALGLGAWRVVAHDGLRGEIEARAAAFIERIVERPEFAVRGVSVTGGSESLRAEVQGALGVEPGMSSLKLDVEELRARVEALGAVKQATVQFDTQGTLKVAVVERLPVVLFRRVDGLLVLLDEGGVEIGPAGPRADHPDLAVIVGAGAEDRVPEVLELLSVAEDVLPRLRALVRIGGRRWDVVLDRDMTVKLPQEGAAEALSRVVALHYGEELLDRDIAVIDMRVPQRPALRMNPEAAETYQIRRAVAVIGGKDT